MNKQEALAKYKDVESELLKLKKIIEASETLFNKIKNYSDVCKELYEKEETCPIKKIKQIERLFNSFWKKDWKNKNQEKWYPYFEYTSSGGLVFYSSSYCYFSTYGPVAFYKDKETSDFVGKTFLDIYKEILD